MAIQLKISWRFDIFTIFCFTCHALIYIHKHFQVFDSISKVSGSIVNVLVKYGQMETPNVKKSMCLHFSWGFTILHVQQLI